MELIMKKPIYYIGIDISAENYTLCVGGEPWKILHKPREFANHLEGYTAMLGWLEENAILPAQAVVCMEATGVYGEGLAYFLLANQYRLAVEPPLKVKRAFMPQGHKNDRVDSQQIAEYSYRFYDELRYWQPKEEVLEQIKVLLTTREQFVKQRTNHRNAFKTLKRKVVATPLAEALHQQSIDRISKQVREIEAEIKRLIDQHPQYGQMVKLLMTIPGVGLLLASHMLLVIEGSPEPSLNPKQIAAYIGVSPYEHSSGHSVYKRPTSRHFGPAMMRKLLYLASLSVRTHHPTFEKYFLRKVAEGKPKKIVLNNIANKLLKIMCAVVRTNTPYIPNYCSVHPSLLNCA
jgi:transposase